MIKTEDALFKWMTENDIKIMTAIRRNDDIIDVYYFLTTDSEMRSFIVIKDDNN
jgi:hypothetical protein